MHFDIDDPFIGGGRYPKNIFNYNNKQYSTKDENDWYVDERKFN
jgi:hypothetical protein